jgi:hypothetical protein
MICPNCQAENPNGKAYCADCGSPLDLADERVRVLVKAALRDALKDQRTLPIEIADKAVERFWFYGKIVGIPSLLVIILLTGLGIKSYRDALGTIQATGQQAATRLHATGQEAVGKLEDQTLKEAQKISQTTATALARCISSRFPVWSVSRSSVHRRGTTTRRGHDGRSDSAAPHHRSTTRPR